jgi:hypothetical protein
LLDRLAEEDVVFVGTLQKVDPLVALLDTDENTVVVHGSTRCLLLEFDGEEEFVDLDRIRDALEDL